MSSKLSAASQPRRSERKRTIKYHVVDLRLDRHALRYAKNWKQVKQYQATPDGRATNARALKKYRATDNGKAVIAAGGKRYRASDHGKAVQRACEARGGPAATPLQAGTALASDLSSSLADGPTRSALRSGTAASSGHRGAQTRVVNGYPPVTGSLGHTLSYTPQYS